MSDDQAAEEDDDETPIQNEPESELEICVHSTPQRVRRVTVRIFSRSKGVPNPILPELGE
jgi:hypothetical protein